MAGDRRRGPKTASAPFPISPNRPKALASLIGDDGRHAQPVFSFALIDRHYEGQWGWHRMSHADARRLHEFLWDMGVLTWEEIRRQTSGGHKKHHPHPIERFCKEAQDRITQRGHDDIATSMFRFRLDGTTRLWGYDLGDGLFYVIWWDPDHKVYPTEPD